MKKWIIALSVSLIAFTTYGQSTILKNSVDDSLSFRSIAVLPIADNVSQIYARPLTIQLKAIVEQDRQWSLKSIDGSTRSPENFEESPELVKSTLKSAEADVLLTTRVSKGPNGISIKMNLFSGYDGLLVVQESLIEYAGFEISDIRTQMLQLYQKMKSKMPYSGIILSRKGQAVTVNLGSLQGIQAGQDLSVVQILKINRHPKFKFIVSTEKEIIGRIRIDKAEESLSFGTISLERSENVIQPPMKLVPVDFVTYPLISKDKEGQIIPGLNDRPDSPMVLGDGQAQEWEPRGAPTFGKVGISLGLGSYAFNNTVSGVGAVDDTSNLGPSIHADGELWLTAQWFMGLALKQYIVKLDNNYPGSSPGKINLSTMQTTLQVGYNFMLEDQFFGPKFQALLGYSKFSANVDTSEPTAYTSMSFQGMALGMAGSFPISELTPMTVGAKLMYYLSPSVSESPVTSGSGSSANMTSFSVFGVYKWNERMNLKGEVLYDLFSASFSGSGSRPQSASSASHTMTTVTGGIEYMF